MDLSRRDHFENFCLLDQNAKSLIIFRIRRTFAFTGIRGDPSVYELNLDQLSTSALQPIFEVIRG